MSDIYILCVEDEPDVLEALERDLSGLESTFPIETANSVSEARSLVGQIMAAGNKIGLVLCDHIMPKENGVTFLVELQENPEMRFARKVLVTGQAGLEATVVAVNQAKLNHYIQKPWEASELLSVAQDQLSEYLLTTQTDFLPYMPILKSPRLLKAIHEKGVIVDE